MDHHVSYILNDDSLFYLTGLKAIQNEKNPGILKCVQIKFNGKDKLIYLTENYQNLRDKLPKISEELFLKYAKKFVSIIKALQEESFLKWNHLDVAKESVFVNPMTNDIYLICLPVTDSAIEKTHSDVNQWMKKVLFDWMLFAFSIPEERREFYLQQLSEEGTQVEVIISNYYNKPIQAEKTDEYQKAVKMRLYNQANALELTEDISEAEDYHKKAMKRAETKEEKQDELFSLGTFYYRNELMLKAEKIAKQAMDQHPEEYFGYQLMFFIGMKKKKFTEVETLLRNINEKFAHVPAFQMNRLAYYDMRGQYTKELELIEEDTVLREVIPEIALQQKTNLLMKRKQYSVAEDAMRELFTQTGDLGAAFSLLLLEMSSKNYIKASEIADYIMESEIYSQGLLYYMTRFVRTIILYMLNKEEDIEEIRLFIREEIQECKEWFEEKGFDVTSVQKVIHKMEEK